MMVGAIVVGRNTFDMAMNLSANGRARYGLPSLVNVQPARVVKVRPAVTNTLRRTSERLLRHPSS